tara:strand:- start:331 stop:879 length:549 start_codon:yes stop_codon:yes gene_type:complete
MSTLKIIGKLNQQKSDYNNMKVWSGFFFDKKFKLPMSTDIVEREQRKQIFLDYKIFLDYDIDLVTIGEALQVLYPFADGFNTIPQVAYAECKEDWELGPHTHDNEVALHMTVFLNEKENEGLYVHNTEENFYNDAVYVKNVYDNCCIFPFTGKEWHGIKGDKIKETRKLLYIDWMKNNDKVQ